MFQRQLRSKHLKKQKKVGTCLMETALPTEQFHGVKGSMMLCCGQKLQRIKKRRIMALL